MVAALCASIHNHSATSLTPRFVQRSGATPSELYCAVLTSDSVSWFHLRNATSAKQTEPEVINTEAGNAAAQNALSEHDSNWLNSSFTKVHCEIPVQLHVYGVRRDSQTDSVPSQPMKVAIADAMKPVTDSLCGSATAMLASTSSEGSDPFEYFDLDCMCMSRSSLSSVHVTVYIHDHIYIATWQQQVLLVICCQQVCMPNGLDWIHVLPVCARSPPQCSPQM